MSKADNWQKLFPSNSFKNEFQKNGSNELLYYELKEAEIENLIANGYKIIGFWPPSSQLDFEIEAKSRLIIFDLTYFRRFNNRICTAILLHEIGHCFSSRQGIEGEFDADDFAIQKGFRNDLLDAMEIEFNSNPTGNFIEERAKRIKSMK